MQFVLLGLRRGRLRAVQQACVQHASDVARL
jgi:hypothetical protein